MTTSFGPCGECQTARGKRPAIRSRSAKTPVAPLVPQPRNRVGEEIVIARSSRLLRNAAAIGHLSFRAHAFVESFHASAQQRSVCASKPARIGLEDP